jgi:formylmethanofuran dehydrogenase subunit E
MEVEERLFFRLADPGQSQLDDLLAASAAHHSHLCPRQVLGVRIGLAGVRAVGVEAHRGDKRLLVIAETDGCFLSGLKAATGAAAERRTLRIVDYGKVAAAFVDTKTGRAVRVAPKNDIRPRAQEYAPDERRYFAMLQGYQLMPDEELLSIQEIQLNPPAEVLVGRPGKRTACARCGEEIINQREVVLDGVTVCLPCAGSAYYSAS